MRIDHLLASKLAGLAVLGALLGYSMTRADGDGVRFGGEGAVAVAANPVRILPASAAAAEWLAVLVPASYVVALPEQMEEYSAMRSTFLAPPWEETARYARFTSETVLAFHPDLVLVSPFTDVSMVERVRAGGAEVMTLKEPTTWEEMERACEELGEVLGAEERGAAFLRELRVRRDALRDRRGRRALRVLPYGNYGSGGSTSGAGTTQDLALSLAGYVNVAAEAGIRGSSDLSHEVVLSLEFDALLVGGSAEESRSAAALRGDAVLRELEAVREERLLFVPTGLHVAGSHAVLDAAEEIARQGDRIGGR